MQRRIPLAAYIDIPAWSGNRRAVNPIPARHPLDVTVTDLLQINGPNKIQGADGSHPQVIMDRATFSVTVKVAKFPQGAPPNADSHYVGLLLHGEAVLAHVHALVHDVS